ncbi:hypothetical protein GCK72_012908 [Caenorhabditis remanei]|uniref:BTB domain-containing protein n=1 Tax=Caenorhabditis remanei TaxID=31234 RepID=A0A6A5GPM5_CAERE|nr:hypothetical protein GCK72_012908 [Caenorhabditis remanei]KAF1756455.1 hypothetical protein GCK72_012908 [Caenorhabditis remanei]
MGANQSHTESDNSDSSGFSDSSESSDSYDFEDHSNNSDCSAMEKRSYLENYLIVECDANNLIGNFWKVKANVTVNIRNFNNDSGSIIHNCGELSFGNHDLDRPDLHRRINIRLVDLLGEDSGFMRNNEIIMETDIRVVEVEGFHQPLVINYRLPPVNSKNLFRFIHSNDTFYCNKAILNAHAKCGRDFDISKMDSFSFKQPSGELFEEFLDCVYGFPISILFLGSVQSLLELSVSFKMRAVARRVEATVIQKPFVYNNNISCRKIAVTFNLRRVLHTWLNKQESIKKKDVEDLDVEKMSGEIMKAIVMRVFEVGWK